MDNNNPEHKFLVYYPNKDSSEKSLKITSDPSASAVIIALINIEKNETVDKLIFSENGVATAHQLIHDEFQTNGYGHVVLNFIARELFNIQSNSQPEVIFRQLQAKTEIEIIDDIDEFMRIIGSAIIKISSLTESDFSNN